MPSSVKMVPVESTAIESIGYDESTRTLHVNFKSGAKYHYAGRTKAEYEAFLAADSHGAHFQKHIRGAQFKRVA